MNMAPKEKRTKVQIAAAAAAGGKTKKKVSFRSLVSMSKFLKKGIFLTNMLDTVISPLALDLV